MIKVAHNAAAGLRAQSGAEFSPVAIIVLLFIVASLIVGAFRFFGSVLGSIFGFLRSPVFFVMVVLGFFLLLAVATG